MWLTPLLELLQPLQLGPQGPLRRRPLRRQGGSALLALLQRRAQLLQLPAQIGLAAAADHQALPQLQQAAPVGLRLVLLPGPPEAELA